MSKSLPPIVCLIFLASPLLADTSVTIDVSGISKSDGNMYLSVFDSKKAWLKKPVLTDSVSVAENMTDGMVSLEVALPAGDYAFSVFQDLDTNGKMKTNFIGIPREPTGVSRGAKGRFGPPKFKDAVVTVGDEPLSLPIELTEI